MCEVRHTKDVDSSLVIIAIAEGEVPPVGRRPDDTCDRNPALPDAPSDGGQASGERSMMHTAADDIETEAVGMGGDSDHGNIIPLASL